MYIVTNKSKYVFRLRNVKVNSSNKNSKLQGKLKTESYNHLVLEFDWTVIQVRCGAIIKTRFNRPFIIYELPVLIQKYDICYQFV